MYDVRNFEIKVIGVHRHGDSNRRRRHVNWEATVLPLGYRRLSINMLASIYSIELVLNDET